MIDISIIYLVKQRRIRVEIEYELMMSTCVRNISHKSDLSRVEGCVYCILSR